MIRCSDKAYAACDKLCKSREEALFLPGSPCDHFNQRVSNPINTNADRVRSMTDEELAAFIDYKRVCPPANEYPEVCDDCNACWLEWLQQPAENPKEV